MFIFLSRMLLFILLGWMIFPKVRALQSNLFQKIVFFGAVGLNIFLLLELLHMMAPENNYLLSDILIVLFGVSVISVSTLGISYNNRYSNKSSFYFVLTIIGFVFSDVAYVIAAYLEFKVFYLADIVANITGLTALLKFLYYENREKDIRVLEV
ncbi:hypothetical protein RM553_17320 [Zunongwangia sp. F363]|uniref:Uncharacterized protein n=1 Tax=Autumnicola tepida TaxID=3075595 RepID=A0ABU3CE23_9FLAO|nr:hypothetical protein [Zunongwangia sp. F363]MDT0644603.1 hypothetical protein [Zunongwangia sp. F363]